MTNASRPRTAAATDARRRQYVERLTLRLRERLSWLDDAWVTSLAGVLWAECRMRGLNVPDLLEEDEEP